MTQRVELSLRGGQSASFETNNPDAAAALVNHVTDSWSNGSQLGSVHVTNSAQMYVRLAAIDAVTVTDI